MNQPAAERRGDLQRHEPRHRRGPGGRRGQDRQAAPRDPRRARAARTPTASWRSRRASPSPRSPATSSPRKYPVVVTVNRPSFELRLWKNLQLVKTYPIAVGPGRARDAGRALPRAEQGGQPGLDDAELGLGRAGGQGQGDPRRHAREPAQGALAGHLRRRRASTARTRRTRSARAASHGCIRMAIPDVIEPVRPGAGRRRRSTSRRRRSRSIGTSRQPASSREACRPVCRMQSVPMNTPRSLLRQHRVPHRRRVARSLDRVPGRTGLSSSSTSPASASWSRVATRPSS